MVSLSWQAILTGSMISPLSRTAATTTNSRCRSIPTCHMNGSPCWWTSEGFNITTLVHQQGAFSRGGYSVRSLNSPRAGRFHGPPRRLAQFQVAAGGRTTQRRAMGATATRAAIVNRASVDGSGAIIGATGSHPDRWRSTVGICRVERLRESELDVVLAREGGNVADECLHRAPAGIDGVAGRKELHRDCRPGP